MGDPGGREMVDPELKCRAAKEHDELQERVNSGIKHVLIVHPALGEQQLELAKFLPADGSINYFGFTGRLHGERKIVFNNGVNWTRFVETEVKEEEGAFKVGDRVRGRDTETDDWKHGKVTALKPMLFVQPDGWPDSTVFNIVEKEPA